MVIGTNMTTKIGLVLQAFEKPYVGTKVKVIPAPKGIAGKWQVIANNVNMAIFTSSLHECNKAAKEFEKMLPD
jgi:hypothetical protein